MKTIRASHARLAVDIVVFIPWPRLPGESNTQTRPGRIWNLESMESGIVILFVPDVFSGVGVVVLGQPMIGKMVLPVFGGTPAVWNTCLVFFQGTLLCGYLFSHGMGQTGLTARRRVSGLYLLALAGLLARELRDAADRRCADRGIGRFRSTMIPHWTYLGFCAARPRCL